MAGQSAQATDAFLFAIRLLDDDDLIGYIELDGIMWTHQMGGVSITTGDPKNWGKGYGYEAMQVVLQFAFDELNLHRVQLTVFTYNARAIALYEKLCFQREGVYREHIYCDGKRHDMYLHGLLAEEWSKMGQSKKTETEREMNNMPLKTVGILSPGDMGHTVGRVLGTQGLRVITCLEGRSKRTRSLAESANIANVRTYQELVSESDIILSILVPAEARGVAENVAGALAETATELVYADCNAISPQTVRQIGETITGAVVHFVDASIIGPPPRNEGTTRFYASGPDLRAFEELSRFGLDIRPLGKEVGLASAIKMCYASLTKGLTALSTELLTAAEIMGVSEALKAEFQLSQSALYKRMEGSLPAMPSKSQRWVGEMEEISATFEHVGLTPKILAGAADMYRFVGGTHLADLSPEDEEASATLAEMISAFADYLKKHNM